MLVEVNVVRHSGGQHSYNHTLIKHKNPERKMEPTVPQIKVIFMCVCKERRDSALTCMYACLRTGTVIFLPRYFL